MQFADEYTFALAEYVNTYGAEVPPAARLARQAICEGLSAFTILDIHLRAAQWLRSDRRGRGPKIGKRRELNSHSISDFLQKILAEYEVSKAHLTSANYTLRQLNKALETQANLIAQALHGEAGQLLTVAFLKLARAEKQASPECAAYLVEVRTSLAGVEQQLRRFSHELKPTLLRDSGLVSALEFLVDSVAERTGLTIRLDCTQASSLPNSFELVLYRFVQEALTNISKHASATEVAIKFLKAEDRFTCSVTDNGVGFDSSVCNFGMGLSGMQQQVQAANGSFRLRSSPGLGAELIAQFPLTHLNSKDRKSQEVRSAAAGLCSARSEEPKGPWMHSISAGRGSAWAKRTMPEPITSLTESKIVRERRRVKPGVPRESISEFRAKMVTDSPVRQVV